MKDPQESNKNGSGVSRRDFLHGSGVTAAAGALGTVALPTVDEADAAQPAGGGATQGQGPGAIRVSFTVNGQRQTTNVEPRVTLLDALRNHMDVTGCKKVCDRGSCGACTVMLENKPVYACSMLAVEAEGKTIRTAESLLENGRLDRVPAAFARFDAQQCGFCTPGFVVAMKAVTEEHRNPTPQQIEEGLGGNICRCGTYEQMRDAIYNLCNQRRDT